MLCYPSRANLDQTSCTLVIFRIFFGLTLAEVQPLYCSEGVITASFVISDPELMKTFRALVEFHSISGPPQSAMIAPEFTSWSWAESLRTLVTSLLPAFERDSRPGQFEKQVWERYRFAGRWLLCKRRLEASYPSQQQGYRSILLYLCTGLQRPEWLIWAYPPSIKVLTRPWLKPFWNGSDDKGEMCQKV